MGRLVDRRKANVFRGHLLGLVTHARNLDILFRKSKSIFQLGPAILCNDGFPGFRPADMENEGPMILDPDSYDVRLIVTPWLTKQGNADGENYSNSVVAMKARVICGQK